jgi:signal transduction histidine kinase
LATSSAPSPSDIQSERTEVLYGTENTTNAILNFLSNIQKRMDICADSTWPSVAMGIDVFKKALINNKNRGIKSRYVVDITKDNLLYCKEVMKLGELRHLDGIKGNFVMSEREYMASATLQEATLLPQVIYSNVKEVIEQQEYVFNSFWNKSVPAELKIREIEEGVTLDVIEVIQNASRAKALYFKIIKSAKEEILLTFPTPDSFIRQEKMGVIQALIESIEKSNLKVRILMPALNLTEDSIQYLRKSNQYHGGNIDVRYIEVTSSNKATILLADRKLSLVMELKDNSKTTFDEAIGLSTYSSSRPGVLSYVSIFENLWIQTELYQQVKEARDSLSRSNKKLEEANEQLTLQDKIQKEFVNVAAHELRTPIVPILNLSELLYSRLKKRDIERSGQIQQLQQEQQMMQVIIRNAYRLHQLTEDILDVTKIESKSLKLKKELFDLSDTASNIINDLKVDNNIILLYKVSKGTDNDKNIFMVYADKGRITQVIYNLLSNAIKFTKQGTITITINIDNLDNNELIISIKDSGSGIDPEILPRLFEKFVTKSDQGTGLGLYISKNIVESHGGRIWAQNNLLDQKGCTFWFTIPVADLQQHNMSHGSSDRGKN